MDIVANIYIKNMENYFSDIISWIPDDFIKLKNQLSCKDYVMAEKKIEDVEFILETQCNYSTLTGSHFDKNNKWDKALNDEMWHNINQLKERITELKLEKEKAKLINL